MTLLTFSANFAHVSAMLAAWPRGWHLQYNFNGNKPARKLTAARVTQVDIFEDTWGYFSLVLLLQKQVSF